MLVALEALLSLPRLRFRASEILDLLDIPPVRERFGLSETDLSILKRWIREANVRWGLDAAQRGELGLTVHDELHTWRFGLERMLMGYAVGEAADDGDDWADIVPYDEVASLDTALVGPLYRLVMTLDSLRKRLLEPQDVDDWGDTLLDLLDQTLQPTTTAEQALLGRIQTALEGWQQEIEEAGLDELLPLAVVRESWLGHIDEPQLSQSLFMGRITFATLMPMRSHYRAGDRSRLDAFHSVLSGRQPIIQAKPSLRNRRHRVKEHWRALFSSWPMPDYKASPYHHCRADTAEHSVYARRASATTARH